jgi:signal transduction histidine kinase
MRERVAELGGELAIDRTGPRGTRITARLPLAQTAAEPRSAASAVLA